MSRRKQRRKTQAIKMGKLSAKQTASSPCDAYVIGRAAFQAGKTRFDNPYNVTTQLAWHEFWDTGWCYLDYMNKRQ